MKITNWMIADRCYLYRNGFVDFIKSTQLSANIEQTTSGKEALNKLATSKPTIVIANINLEKIDGIDLFRTLLHRGINHHQFVFVSEIHWIENTYSRYANFLLWHLKNIGINHIATKEELDEQTLNNLFKAIKHQTPFISDAPLQSFNNAFKENSLLESKMHKLTEREREYLLYFANHKSQSQIAVAMHIDTTTVNSYRGKVLKKFNLNSTDDLKRFCSTYHLFNLNSYSINTPHALKNQ